MRPRDPSAHSEGETDSLECMPDRHRQLVARRTSAWRPGVAVRFGRVRSTSRDQQGRFPYEVASRTSLMTRSRSLLLTCVCTLLPMPLLDGFHSSFGRTSSRSESRRADALTSCRSSSSSEPSMTGGFVKSNTQLHRRLKKVWWILTRKRFGTKSAVGCRRTRLQALYALSSASWDVNLNRTTRHTRKGRDGTGLQ